jgi:hypothetical protein
MNEGRIAGCPLWTDPQGHVMKTPDDVAAMLRLKACSCGQKRIAAELGLQPPHGQAVRGGERRAAVFFAQAGQGARWRRGLAARALFSASGQRRRRASRSSCRKGAGREPANAAARFSP